MRRGESLGGAGKKGRGASWGLGLSGGKLSLCFEGHALWPPHPHLPPASSLPPPAPELLVQLAFLQGGAPDRGPWTT